MTRSNENAIDALNDLIETCEDGQKGFTEASEGVKDTSLRSQLANYAAQRQKFITELQEQVRALGGKPETTGSAAGALHRGWIDLKSAITGKDEQAIVAECEKGEDAAKASYEKVLNSSDLPGTLLPLVERQFAQVKETHDRIRDLRDSLAVAK